MLNISENKRFMMKEDGAPFFYMGDTAWELFHRLDREQTAAYLETRKEQGFNVVQAVILFELEGLAEQNAYGEVPLLQDGAGKYDPSRPAEIADRYDYWKHIDYVVDYAASLDLVIGIVPTWGDKVLLGNPFAKGPEIFNVDNARQFGRYVGKRYKDKPNIVWILGGDRNPDERIAVWRAMAGGLREGDGGNHLITYHPMGGFSSSIWFHHDEWCDYHTHQSGHFGRHLANYNLIAKDYHIYPPKPTIDGEPRYEDHSVNWNEELGFFLDYDVRQAAYWAVLAGAFGHVYGHTSVWQFYEPGRTAYSGAKLHWQEALSRPGAAQMKHVRALFESRPFLELVPDQSLITNQLEGADHIRAARGRGYMYVYSATGQPFEVSMGRITGDHVRASWYDPRTGETSSAHPQGQAIPNQGKQTFLPPTSGIGEDWVLILDDAAS
ncbi:glycoside hydrolase family 140 protein [Paenibacillus lignilyticus]|uniref:Glycoside hydrolase family 140 protein n=1 Tax=Paenibacillus lignilyticus TaxID=1172615 RepID=A0ABS5CJK3_9BACL|nr:glycoside hydrolase family 140 protein [Paenibacillus lignilyticus]MBP3966007.1 glycoside hydrolase family 140 protein [Paenibacillus lignilyticus]